MKQAEVEAFTAGLERVECTENYGYIFFFVGDDHFRPFVTLASADYEYDSVSHLDREGVFRVNIGVGRETFDSLVGAAVPEEIDYTALNVFLPHPEYARQHFLCILNPSGENADKTRELIVEAHGLAAARLARREEKKEGE